MKNHFRQDLWRGSVWAVVIVGSILFLDYFGCIKLQSRVAIPSCERYDESKEREVQ